MLLNITHKGKRMHDLRNPHERHLWIFVPSTTETFPWMTACFQPFPLIRPIRTQYCLKALHYFKYLLSILDEFPNGIKWKKQKKQRNVHISEQTKITSFNHFLCPTVGIQKISIYCQQWQIGKKKNNKSAHLEAPTSIFFWQSKWKQTTKEPWLKDETKSLFHQLSKQASDRLILALVLTGVSVLHFPLRAGLRSLCRGPTGWHCSMTAGPERRPSSRRSTLSVWILFSHQKNGTDTQSCVSVRPSPAAGRRFGKPEWEGTTMVIGRWKDVAIVLNSRKKKREASTRARASSWMIHVAPQHKKAESHFHLKAPSCSYHVWSHPRIKTRFDGQGK